jgi:hypothetical protein
MGAITFFGRVKDSPVKVTIRSVIGLPSMAETERQVFQGCGTITPASTERDPVGTSMPRVNHTIVWLILMGILCRVERCQKNNPTEIL